MWAFLTATFSLAALASAQTVRVDRLKADLTFLTSREMKGRAALENGTALAARFLAAELAKAGVKPCCDGSYLQEFELTSAPLDTEQSVVEWQGEKIGFTGGHPRPIEIRGPVVFAGYGVTAPEHNWDDYADIDVKGKVVLIFEREPRESDEKSVFLGRGLTKHAAARSKRLNAQEHGALAVLVLPNGRSAAAPADPNPNRGGARTLYDEAIRTPMLTLRKETAVKMLPEFGKIQEALDESGKPASRALDGSVRIKLVPRRAETARCWNVLGWIEGSDPKLRREAVLIGSHYDHLPNKGEYVYPGANDNGSGTVVVVELARIFAAGKKKLRRSVIFASFGAEENGLLGSYYYVAKPPPGLPKVTAVINLDMVGRDEAHTSQTEGRVPVPAETLRLMNVIGGAYFPELARVIERANRAIGFDLDSKYDRDSSQSALWRCDHFPFLIAGIPAVWLFGGWHPGYHEPSDTADKINWDKMERVTRLAYLAAEELAR